MFSSSFSDLCSIAHNYPKHPRFDRPFSNYGINHVQQFEDSLTCIRLTNSAGNLKVGTKDESFLSLSEKMESMFSPLQKDPFMLGQYHCFQASSHGLVHEFLRSEFQALSSTRPFSLVPWNT
jgi:hypothetical protein